jgi:transposase
MSNFFNPSCVARRNGVDMESKYRRCCGMDVHQKTVVACVLPPDGQNGKPIQKVFGTFRNDLARMRGWLKMLKVTEIAMESTGVYWRPVWNVLEGHGFAVLLANPKQVKALQGRKSDRRDSERIAQFAQDRRLDASFVPPPEIRRLRELLRYRVSLLEQRNETHNKIRDLFESAHLKLSSVVSDLLGLTGRCIVEALIAGETSPDKLSWKVKGHLRKKEKQVRASLVGCFDEFHRGMLELLWKQYGFLSAQILEVESRVETAMEPHQEILALLAGIPGVDRRVAWTVIAEMGVDMSVFPDAAHAASWVGICPGTCQSAGKRLDAGITKGNRYLRRGLLQAAWGATRKKDCYLQSFFQRLKYRHGWPKAIGAVAHKILVIVYQILRTRTPYQELGGDYYDQLHPEKNVRRLVARLQNLGVEVTLTERSPLPNSGN